MKDARRRRLPTSTFRGTMCSKELVLTPRQVSAVAIQVVSKYHQRLIRSRSGAWVLTLPTDAEFRRSTNFVTFAGILRLMLLRSLEIFGLLTARLVACLSK